MYVCEIEITIEVGYTLNLYIGGDLFPAEVRKLKIWKTEGNKLIV